jgi:hypothetical protein
MRTMSTIGPIEVSPAITLPREMANATQTTTSGAPQPFSAQDREVARVRNLLDRAIASTFHHAQPAAVPPLTATRWAWRLAGLYHLTHSTPALLGIAAGRFAAAGRRVLADWARERAREESHHDLLALRDLLALGYDAERVIERVRPDSAMKMVEYFERSVRAPDPIGCVGYAYAIERLAMTVREPDIRAVEAVLPPGVRATRCLRVHSAAGSDGDHVADTLAAVALLGADERAQIAEAARDTARICFTPSPGGPPSDAQIAEQLAPCRLH